MSANAMLKKASHGIEAALYRRGFSNPEVRRLVAWQLWLAGISCLALAPLAFFGAFAAGYAAGAFLITVNFYFLAKFVQQLVQVRKGAVVALLFHFYLRLAGTGLALYGLIVWAKVPVPALLLGLSTVLVTALGYGASRLSGQNVKEA